MPMGLVTANTTIENKRICIHPMVVINSPSVAPVQSYAGKFPVAAISFCSPVATLKLFRPEQRVNQISRDKKRNDKSDDIFQSHFALLQTIAAADIKPGEIEKADRNAD
jgi:hypothetical protein